MRKFTISPVIAATVVSLGVTTALADDWTAVRLRGGVFALENGAWTQLLRGSVVPDDRVIRSSSNGRITLVRGAETIELGPDTTVQIADQAGFTTVYNHAGAVGVDAEVQNVQHFAVQTNYLAAVVKGTAFTVVALPDTTTVAVTRGSVEVDDEQHGTSVNIVAGEQVSSSQAAPISQELIIAVSQAIPPPPAPAAQQPAPPPPPRIPANDVSAGSNQNNPNNAPGNNVDSAGRGNGPGAAGPGQSDGFGGGGPGNSGNAGSDGNGNNGNGNSGNAGNGNGGGENSDNGHGNGAGNGNGNNGNGNDNGGPSASVEAPSGPSSPSPSVSSPDSGGGNGNGNGGGNNGNGSGNGGNDGGGNGDNGNGNANGHDKKDK